MNTKRKQLATKLNEHFREAIKTAMWVKFDLDTENDYNIISMRLVTTRADGKPFTKTQYEWLGAFSEGYAEAMGFVEGASL